jgi:release factor glutamine methyltransferase
MTLGDLYRKIKTELAAEGIDTAALDARVLLCHALSVSHEDFILKQEVTLTDTDVAAINALIAQRLQRKPVAKIIGKKEFYGLEFITTLDTLDPRPDSEIVIDQTLQHIHDKNALLRILDLGTGTGCLLLSTLHALPNASGLGVDQSSSALNIARENARHLGLMTAADFVQGNWFEHVIGRFDIILSNPPYIPSGDILTLAPDVRLFDPHDALDGGTDGLECYRRIIADAASFLAPGGLLIFELGIGQAEPVSNILKSNNFLVISTGRDLSGIDRVLVAKCL